MKTDVSVFEFNIRFVGGLLSSYALSKEEVKGISRKVGGARNVGGVSQ